jgi:hypothetical protein
MQEPSLDPTIWSSRLASPLREAARLVAGLAYSASCFDRGTRTLEGFAMAFAQRALLLDDLADTCTPHGGLSTERLVPAALEPRVRELRGDLQRAQHALRRSAHAGCAAPPGGPLERRLDRTVVALDILLGRLDELLDEDVDAPAA